MKTLNKTLCLVLALVMVLGLFGVASATSFKDNADIQYAEAVSVMTGIGAINGYEDGTFSPKGNVSRAEAAKLVVYSILGADVAKTLSAEKSSFSDVDDNTNAWAGGAIEYLASKGIVNGLGDGNYNPNGKVTAYEIAKMMLVAAGYGKNGEYTGAQWQLQVAIDAAKCKIFEGSKVTDFSAAATREEAALYTFNGIQVELVAYSKDKEIYAPADGKAATATPDNTILTNVYPKVNHATVTAVENGGVAGTIWWIEKGENTAFDKTVDTLIGTYNTEAASASYTAGTTVADIAKAQGVKAGDTPYTVNIYRNGEFKKTITKTGTELYAMTTANDTILGGVTAEVVVPANTTNTFNILYTVHYLAKLKSVTLDPIDDENDTRALNISIIGYDMTAAEATGYAFDYGVTAKDYDGFDTIFNMVKDQTAKTLEENPVMVDVVPTGDSHTYTNDNKGTKTTILSVAMPTSVEGKASEKDTTKNTVTIDGKTYVMGHKASLAGISYTKTYKFIVDATGAIAFYKEVTATADASDVYYATGYVFPKSTETEFGTVASYYAQVIDMSGKASSVMVGAPTASDGNYDPAKGVKTLAAGLYTFATDTTPESKSATLGFKKATAATAALKDIGTTSTIKEAYGVIVDTSAANNGVDVTEKTTVLPAGSLKEEVVSTGKNDETKVYLTSTTNYIFVADPGAALTTEVVTGGVNTTIPTNSLVLCTKDADKNCVAKAVIIVGEYENAGVASDSVLYFAAESTGTKAYTAADGTTKTGYVYTVYDATGAAKTITTTATVETGFWTYKVTGDVYTAVTELDYNKGAYETLAYASKVGTKITATATNGLEDVEAGSAKIVDLRTAAQKVTTGISTITTLADIAAAKTAGKNVTLAAFTTKTNNVESVAIIFVTAVATSD